MLAYDVNEVAATEHGSPSVNATQTFPESIDIFSALHDSINEEVRIFTAVYPRVKCNTIKYCR